MSYDTVATYSQVGSLLLFIFLFLMVLVYVFWPTTAATLEKEQRVALDLADPSDPQSDEK